MRTFYQSKVLGCELGWHPAAVLNKTSILLEENVAPFNSEFSKERVSFDIHTTLASFNTFCAVIPRKKESSGSLGRCEFAASVFKDCFIFLHYDYINAKILCLSDHGNDKMSHLYMGV